MGYISSDSIYEVSTCAAEKWKADKFSKQGKDVSVTEDAGLRPRDKAQQETMGNADSYGHGKLEAEEVLAEKLPDGCRSISLRLPDVIGPYDDTLRLWAYWHWLRAGEAGAPPPQIQKY